MLLISMGMAAGLSLQKQIGEVRGKDWTGCSTEILHLLTYEAG